MSQDWPDPKSTPYASLQDAMARISMQPWQKKLVNVGKALEEDLQSQELRRRINARLKLAPWTA